MAKRPNVRAPPTILIMKSTMPVMVVIGLLGIEIVLMLKNAMDMHILYGFRMVECPSIVNEMK